MRKQWKLLISIGLLIIMLGLLVELGSVVDFAYRDDLHIIWKKRQIGVDSPSGKYRLVEATDYSGKYIIYSIITDEPYENIYVTPIWYHSRYISGGVWAKNVDDFFIVSSDTGISIYRYMEGTWNNDYSLSWEHDAYGRLIPDRFSLQYYENGVLYEESYDIENLPDIVLSYAKKHK